MICWMIGAAGIVIGAWFGAQLGWWLGNRKEKGAPKWVKNR